MVPQLEFHVPRHEEVGETISPVLLECMQEFMLICTAVQIVEVAGRSRKSRRRSRKNLQVKFATAEHALPAPVASPLWDQVDVTLLMCMVTDTGGHLAAGLYVCSKRDEVVRRVLQTTFQEVDSLQSVSEEHAAITLELLQELLKQAVSPAYDRVMLHTDGAPCL